MKKAAETGAYENLINNIRLKVKNIKIFKSNGGNIFHRNFGILLNFVLL